MSMGIQSFDNLYDNRVLRYCTDFEAHTLRMDTKCFYRHPLSGVVLP